MHIVFGKHVALPACIKRVDAAVAEHFAHPWTQTDATTQTRAAGRHASTHQLTATQCARGNVACRRCWWASQQASHQLAGSLAAPAALAPEAAPVDVEAAADGRKGRKAQRGGPAGARTHASRVGRVAQAGQHTPT